MSKDPKTADYWEFDFEEMGTYDVPAFVDFILSQTKDTNVLDGKLAAYIGHSEGTTQFFIGASMKPDFYTQKVNTFVALAPIVRLDHSSSAIMVWAAQSAVYKLFEPAVKLTHMYDLIDLDPTAAWLSSGFCRMLPHFCSLMNDGFWDFHDDIDNSARWADKVAHSPAGSGWRNLAHYALIIREKAFVRWDAGKKENMKRYGQATPPEYDLSKVNVKMIFAHGDVDALSNPTDVKWLMDKSQSKLNTDLLVFQKQYHFAHSSFSMSMDVSYITDDRSEERL